MLWALQSPVLFSDVARLDRTESEAGRWLREPQLARTVPCEGHSNGGVVKEALEICYSRANSNMLGSIVILVLLAAPALWLISLPLRWALESFEGWVAKCAVAIVGVGAALLVLYYAGSFLISVMSFAE